MSATSHEVVQAARTLGAAQRLRLLDEQAAQVEEHALAASTRRYYARDFAAYEQWCAAMGLAALPCRPASVRLYLVDLASRFTSDGEPIYRASSIERRLASLSHHHDQAGYGRGLARDPLIATTMRAIRRQRQESVARKRPLLVQDLRALVEAMEHHRYPTGIAAARDTLLFVLAFATAMRREELSRLRIRDVSAHPTDGLWVRVATSKTDQAGAGVRLAVPRGQYPITCCLCALVRWTSLLVADDRVAAMRVVVGTPMRPSTWQHHCDDALLRRQLAALPQDEYLFRSVTKGGQVAANRLSTSGMAGALNRRLRKAHYDAQLYGMHSFRAGFVTQARRNGADARAVRRQTRHGSDAMVDVYDREWNPLEGNAVGRLGL